MFRDTSNWRRRRDEFSEDRKQRVIAGLLELSRARKFDGVWLLNDRIFVKRHALGEMEYMSWKEAAALVEPPKIDAKAEKLNAKMVQGRKSGQSTRNGNGSRRGA
jgi:hypothetical protein